ncbi:MAG: hypothetical protein ACKN9W_06445 [Methylococcus sp.]
MKKLILMILVALSAIGCARKEKTGLREVLIERFKDDSDLKDYNLDPANIADCVVDEISSSLPGFAGDPRRGEFFKAYERFLSVKSEADAEKSIAEFEKLFGSVQKARQAATSIPDHIMTCMGKAIEGSDTEGHRAVTPP